MFGITGIRSGPAERYVRVVIVVSQGIVRVNYHRTAVITIARPQ